MTATSASGWETTSKDRVERGKFRIRVPSNPLLKEREGAQADTLTINQALQHALWNRRKNSLACGLTQNRALSKNDHDRSEASHASLTASGSEPTAGGRDYYLQSCSSPHCPTCICGAAISCIGGAGPTPVTMGGRFASAALVRPPFYEVPVHICPAPYNRGAGGADMIASRRRLKSGSFSCLVKMSLRLSADATGTSTKIPAFTQLLMK